MERTSVVVVALALAGACGGSRGIGTPDGPVDASTDRTDAADAPAFDRPDGAGERGADADVPDLGDADADPFAGCPADPVVDSGVGSSCRPPIIPDRAFHSATTWIPSGGAILTCGAAVLDEAALCKVGGIRQTFALPAPEPACTRPLVLTVDREYGLTGGSEHGELAPLAVAVNGGWNTSPTFHGPTTFCLGAGALGASLDLFVGPAYRADPCPAQNWTARAAIHRVSIDADTADVCPAIGTVRNGDFEGGQTGWTGDNGTALEAVLPGIGRGGSAGAIIRTTKVCQAPAFTGTISVPTFAMVPYPALRVWSSGTEGEVIAISLGPSQSAHAIVGTATPRTQTLCMPRWAQGTVQPIRFALPVKSGACVTDDVRGFTFDDLTFVSDPSCTANANVFNPGFEQPLVEAATAPSWFLGGNAHLVVDATLAHSGSTAALLGMAGPCDYGVARADVTIPTSAGLAGPALKLWYKTGSHPPGIQIDLLALTSRVSLPASPDWEQAIFCLDPRFAGRPDALSISVRDGGVCSDLYPAPRTLSVDDVELTTDPACPAN